jgi:glycosyltransferase 2 family protein
MRKYLVVLVKLVIAVGVLAWLFAKIDLVAVGATLRSVRLGTSVIAAILVTFPPFIAAVRWHLIMKFLGAATSFGRTLQISWIGLAAVTLLPGGVASDGIRMWLLTRSGMRPSKGIDSVLLDRAAALIGLLLLVAASLPFVDQRVASAPVRNGTSAVLVIGVLVGVAIGLCIRVPARWQRFRAVRAVLNLSSDLSAVCWPPWRALSVIVLSASGIWFNSFVIFFLIRSLGGQVGLLDCMALGPLVILAITLPISLGGWGIREGSMVGIFAIVGVAPAVSLSASVLIGLLSTAVCLPGALVWLQWKHSAPGLATAWSE